MGRKYASGEDSEIGDVVECVEDTDTPYDISVLAGVQYSVIKHDYHHVWIDGQNWGFWKSRFKLISRQEKPMPFITYPPPAVLTFNDLDRGDLFAFADVNKEQSVRQKVGDECYHNLMMDGDFTGNVETYPANRDRIVYRLTMTTTPQFKALAK